MGKSRVPSTSQCSQGNLARPPALAASTEKACGVERVYFCKPLDRICDESGMERNFLLSFSFAVPSQGSHLVSWDWDWTCTSR